MGLDAKQGPMSNMERTILQTAAPWAMSIVANLVREHGGDPHDWEVTAHRMIRTVTGKTSDLVIEVTYTKPGDIPRIVLTESIGPTLDGMRQRFVKIADRHVRAAYHQPKPKPGPWTGRTYVFAAVGGVLGGIIGYALFKAIETLVGQ